MEHVVLPLESPQARIQFDQLRKEKNTLVEIRQIKLDRFDVFHVMRRESMHTRIWLGSLVLESSYKIFQRFLEKFCVQNNYKESRIITARWEIEFGILHNVINLLKQDPKDLERIIKVAQNKKDLKIHLGIS